MNVDTPGVLHVDASSSKAQGAKRLAKTELPAGVGVTNEASRHKRLKLYIPPDSDSDDDVPVMATLKAKTSQSLRSPFRARRSKVTEAR